MRINCERTPNKKILYLSVTKAADYLYYVKIIVQILFLAKEFPILHNI